MRIRGAALLIGAGLVCLLSSAMADEQKPVDVLTYHYDNWRTGWNSEESGLTPAAVRNGSFGLLYKVDDLDEQVDAQPLVLSNFAVGAERKTVVLVVTEYNTLYAIDAATGAKIAKRSFGAPAPFLARDPANPVCGNASDHLGINSTPVINAERDTLYLIAAVWSGGAFDYVLFAVDLTTIGDAQHPLADKVAPVKVAASAQLSDGTVYAFQPGFARQRSALLLANDRVYAGFSTMCDQKPDVSRGWLLGWDARSLAPLKPVLTDKRPVSKVGSGRLGAIWMSGYGPAADEAGNVFVVTGNSFLPADHETLPPVQNGPDTYLSDSVVRFSPDLAISDWFTPSDKLYGQHTMDGADADFGAGGVVLIPKNEATGDLPVRAAVAAGKTGQMYLMNQNSLGKFDPAGVNHVLDVKGIGPCYCGPSYFEGADGKPRIVSSGNIGLRVWRINPSGQSVALALDYPSSEPLGTTFFQKGFFTSVSSNGHMPDSTIIWAIRRPQKDAPSQSLILHAFDAKDGAHLCAAEAGPWPMDEVNAAAPNVVPVIANGKVFVASYKQLNVFGIGGANVCGVQIARTNAQFTAISQSASVLPTEGEFGVVKGTIVDVAHGKLHLKTRDDKTFLIDLSKVLANGRYGNIDPGKPVTIRGTGAADGALIAESIFSGD